MASQPENKQNTAKLSLAKQMELFLVMKQQLNLFFKQLNYFRSACKCVDRLNKAMSDYKKRSLILSDGLSQDRSKLFIEFVKFERNYRVWRKRLRKLDKELLNVDLYDKLYDLYESLKIHSCESSEIFKSNTTVTACENCTGREIEATNVGLEVLVTEDDIEVQLETSKPVADVSARRTRQQQHRLTSALCPKVTTKSQFTQTEKSIASIHSKPITKLKNKTKKLSNSMKVSRKLSKSRTVTNLKSVVNEGLSGESKPKKFKQQQQSDTLKFCKAEGCRYSTFRPGDMKKHMASHSDLRPFKCDKCEKAFKMKGHLKEHQFIHEPVKRVKKPQLSKLSRLFVCEVEGCQYSTRNSWSMSTHRTIHSDDRPFQCDQCELAFKVKNHLRLHQNIHAGIRFRCRFESCTASYSKQQHLNRHVRIVHTKEAPLLRCDFDGCEYHTYNVQYLRNHRVIHNDERPYKCVWPDCGQAFKSLSTLSGHKHSHENKLRYRCSYAGCDYAGNQRGGLRRHEKLIHEKKLKDQHQPQIGDGSEPSLVQLKD